MKNDITERLERAALAVEQTSIKGIGFAEDFRAAIAIINTARTSARMTQSILSAIRSDLNHLHGGDLEIADSIELLRQRLERAS
jgi:hypothetical protein